MLGSFTESAVVLYEKLTDLHNDQKAFSEATFGADTARGPIGAFRHLAKEAAEAADRLAADDHVPGTPASPEALTEMADCFLLLLDGLRRAGHKFGALVDAARAKLEVNKTRTWPAPTDATTPIEHVRAVEPAAPAAPAAGEGTIPAGLTLRPGPNPFAVFAATAAADAALAAALPAHLCPAAGTFTPADFKRCVGPFARDFDRADLELIAQAANCDAHEGAEWMPYYKAANAILVSAFAGAMACLRATVLGKFNPVGRYNHAVRLGRQYCAQMLLVGRGPSGVVNPRVQTEVDAQARHWATDVLAVLDPRR